MQRSFLKEITPRICAPPEIQKKKPNLQMLFDVTQKFTREQKIGDVGSVRIELGNFYMGEAGPGGRRRGDQAHEGEGYVFSDSVLCVGRIHEFPESNAERERRIRVLKRHISVQCIGWNLGRTIGVRVEEEDLGQGVPCAFPHLRQVCSSVLVHVCLLQKL